jgi:hypothetical protein
MFKRVSAIKALPCVFAFAMSIQAASAENGGAETAAKLLAKSQAADTKCHYLSSADHGDLASLVARAEVALAGQTDIAKTKRTMAVGREQGRSAKCDPAQAKDIADIIAAARAASQNTPQITAAAPEPQANVAVANSAPSSTVQPKPVVTPANPAAPVVARTKQTSPVSKPHVSGGLEIYASMTERYYKARRCNSMSRWAMNSFYHQVVSTHYAMVKNYGVRAVADVMHQSESTANRQVCG